MKADSADRSFVQGMTDLLGYDEDQTDTVLSLLSPDELIDLADCISQDDRAGAKDIIQSAAIDEDDEDKRKLIDILDKSDDGKTELNDDDDKGNDIQYAVGDEIKLEGDDQEATVRIPHGPSGTVGVMVGGKLKMVTRNEIERVDENDDTTSLLGISLDRIRKLAGLGAQTVASDEDEASCPSGEVGVNAEPETDEMETNEPETTEIEVVSPFGSAVSPSLSGETDSDSEVEDCPVDQANTALDALANALPNIKLGDLKAIRQKLNDVQMKMNEDARRLPLGRKPKRT